MERRRSCALAIVLSLTAACGLSVFAEKAAPAPVALSNDQKILHALNRLTFGPRPGDFDEVKRLGLKKWIDIQLHPDRIPQNPALEAKLAPLDTLRMTPSELAHHYPPPQLIKAMVEGKVPYPSDPEERMMIDNAVRRFKVQQGEGGDEKPTLESVGDAPRGKKGMKAATLWELHPVTVMAFAPTPAK